MVDAEREIYVVFVSRTTLVEPEPISINKAYTPFHGTMRLTKAGKAYKDALASAVATSSFEWKKAGDSIYQHGGWASVHIRIYLTDLLNKSWKPNTFTKAGNPRSPHRRKDGPNYLKLTLDAIERGSGIDDCNYTDVRVTTHQDLECPRIEVTLATYVSDKFAYVELMDS